MKALIFSLLLIISTQAFAAKKAAKQAEPKIAPIESCFKSEDNLEREFCQKKRLKAISDEFDVTFDKIKGGYTQDQKDKIKSDMQKDIDRNKEIIKLLADELKLREDNLAKINATLTNEEKEKAEKDSADRKKKEQIDKAKKVLKKIF